MSGHELKTGRNRLIGSEGGRGVPTIIPRTARRKDRSPVTQRKTEPTRVQLRKKGPGGPERGIDPI